MKATIWDLPSPIHKASKKRKQSRSRNLCCSNEFQRFFGVSSFQPQNCAQSCVGFGGLKLISSVWAAAVPGFTVDLASKLTDNKTPKHNLPKTENQNKPKSNRYGCYCCWFPPVRSSQKLFTSRFVKVHHNISLCWQKCFSCSNPLSAKNARVLPNIVLQVNKYGGIYRLGVRVPTGSIVKTMVWTRKQTLQSCLFDFHVNHPKKEELKHRL